MRAPREPVAPGERGALHRGGDGAAHQSGLLAAVAWQDLAARFDDRHANLVAAAGDAIDKDGRHLEAKPGDGRLPADPQVAVWLVIGSAQQRRVAGSAAEPFVEAACCCGDGELRDRITLEIDRSHAHRASTGGSVQPRIQLVGGRRR